MADRTPQPIAYATRSTDAPLSADLPPVTWRTAAAAAWLVSAVCLLGVTVADLGSQQLAIASLPIAVPSTAVDLARLATTVAWPCVYGFAFGCAAAAALYGWSPRRLIWTVLLPVAIGAWSAVQVVARPFDPPSLAGLGIAIAVQAGLIFAGTRAGRPLARWLARHLVPPPLRASLVALWI